MKNLLVLVLVRGVMAAVLTGCPVTGLGLPPLVVGQKINVGFPGPTVRPGDIQAISGAWVQIKHDIGTPDVVQPCNSQLRRADERLNKNC